MKKRLILLTAALFTSATATEFNPTLLTAPEKITTFTEQPLSQLDFNQLQERLEQKFYEEESSVISPEKEETPEHSPSADSPSQEETLKEMPELISEPAEAKESTPHQEAEPKAKERSDQPAQEKEKKDQTSETKASSKKALKEEKRALPIEDLRLFVEILEQLKENYVDPVTDSKLIENAIKGMVAELDPHSDYYDEEAFTKLQEQTMGSFAGLGIEVNYDSKMKALRVVKPLFEGPAEKAGILAEDRIVEIDKKPVKELTLESAIKMLRGKVGTEVDLVIDRAGESLEFTVTREKIETDSVTKSALYNEETAYIRLEQFQESTAKEIRKHFTDLQKEAKEKETEITGLILDLRDNPGGLLLQAVEVADLFLDSGLIVYTQGQKASSKEEYHAKEGDLLKGAPIIILINSSSASASEIVAGALQDHQRALIIGEQSFGKGSVQTMVKLENGQGLKYTSARYYTPNGKSIQTLGIVPDVVVAPLNVSLKKGVSSLREADIKGHLVHTDETKKEDKKSDAKGSEKSTQKEEAPKESLRKPVDNSAFAEEDYPLYEALNILRALNIQNQLKQ